MAQLSLEEATRLALEALRHAGAGSAMAASTAKALVRAEAQGLASHGLIRVAQYATHLRNGRANGSAVARVARHQGAAVLVDAGQGLAFPACDLAVSTAIATARSLGVSFAGVTNSHHCGVLVDHLRAVADAGLVGLAFANSPAAMPAAGGKHAIFGTNPVAAVFPRRSADPLMIDLSLSEVARGKLMVAAREGQAIPPGWALDSQGQPTTDPTAGLAGSMLPLGAASSPKGAMLALIVELLVTALLGAQFGFEASSFFVDEGNAPRLGQAFVVINPGALAGQDVYYERMETLITEMLVDDGVRLAGARRIALERQAGQSGLTIPDTLHEQLHRLTKMQ
ncbi:Ldh family oxidoreductase [Polaromonas sp. YR568]|uniref:Ldh family oxidoreductase n=1 Tax=Polaromonas sp. YR568 TaxID=1855301 RepID=UPI00313789DA